MRWALKECGSGGRSEEETRDDRERRRPREDDVASPEADSVVGRRGEASEGSARPLPLSLAEKREEKVAIKRAWWKLGGR